MIHIIIEAGYRKKCSTVDHFFILYAIVILSKPSIAYRILYWRNYSTYLLRDLNRKFT